MCHIFSINNGKRDRSAIFAEHELQLTDDWLVLSAARAERVMRNADRAAPYSLAGIRTGADMRSWRCVINLLSFVHWLPRDPRYH